LSSPVTIIIVAIARHTVIRCAITIVVSPVAIVIVIVVVSDSQRHWRGITQGKERGGYEFTC